MSGRRHAHQRNRRPQSPLDAYPNTPSYLEDPAIPWRTGRSSRGFPSFFSMTDSSSSSSLFSATSSRAESFRTFTETRRQRSDPADATPPSLFSSDVDMEGVPSRPIIQLEDIVDAAALSARILPSIRSGLLSEPESSVYDSDETLDDFALNEVNELQNAFSDNNVAGRTPTSPQGSRFRNVLDLMRQQVRPSNRARRQPAPSPIHTPSSVILYKFDQRSSDTATIASTGSGASKASYLPLVPINVQATGYGPSGLTVMRSHKDRIDAEVRPWTRPIWPAGSLPIELFEAIIAHLSREDVKSMRLVSKEFEQKVSSSFFDTVVVPFNTELYDMIEQERTAKRDPKGKGKATDLDLEAAEMGPLLWKNAKEDKEHKVYKGHGLEVFRGFGQYIRNFGMSFEVREDALQDPPKKQPLERVESYYGSYNWPHSEYTRFDALAGLERTADETSQMKIALSHLSRVQQLGLSLDNGLGWLPGPDKSLRTQVLQNNSAVFGDTQKSKKEGQKLQQKLWEDLKESHEAAGTLHELKEGHLCRLDLKTALPDVPGLAGTSYCDPKKWSAMSTAPVVEAARQSGLDIANSVFTGLLCVARNEIDPDTRSESKDMKILPTSHCFSPNSLSKNQKEWLLEAEWAQKAFLQSYMLAIVDNPTVFGKVTVLNLARLSSQFVPMLCRSDFWDALPTVSDVTLRVSPAWRTVARDDAGFAEDHRLDPSKAHDPVYQLLQNHIGNMSSVKKLHFGWTDGGEYAEGVLARNKQILPAPVTLLARARRSSSGNTDTIILPFIQQLTLSNCWITPPNLINLVHNLERMALRRVVLDSVSLTAHPRFVVNNALGHPGANNLGQFGAGQFNWEQGFAANHLPMPNVVTPPTIANQIANQFWQGPLYGVQPGAWAATMLQQMQHWMAQRGITPPHLPNVIAPQLQPGTLSAIYQALVAATQGQLQPGQTVQAHAQAGIAHHMAQGLGMGGPQLPPAATFPTNHAPATNQPAQHWYDDIREGSWTDIIHRLSPGATLDDYRHRGEFDPEPQRRKTGLVNMELQSCGYAQLAAAPFDQTTLEPITTHRYTAYFQRRHAALASRTMSTSDVHLGHIVQYMTDREQDALRFAWGCRMGWDDDFLAEGPEYDGLLAGGTGRFSGVVGRETQVNRALFD